MENMTNNPPYLGNGVRQDVSSCYLHIGIPYGLSIATEIGDLD